MLILTPVLSEISLKLISFSNSINIYQHIISDTFNITVNSDTLSVQAGYFYQWFNDGAIVPFAKNFFYVPTETGNYYVLITDTNSCNYSSDTVYLFVNEVAENSYQKINIFPNPNDGNFTISNNSSKQIYVRIYNNIGKLIIERQSSEKYNFFNLSNFSEGVYFIEIIGEEINKYEKIIIHP